MKLSFTKATRNAVLNLPSFFFVVTGNFCVVTGRASTSLSCVVTTGTTVVRFALSVTTVSDCTCSWCFCVVTATVGWNVFEPTSLEKLEKPKLLQRSPVQHSYRQSVKSSSEQAVLSSQYLVVVHSLLKIVVFLLREKAWTTMHLSKRSSNEQSSMLRSFSFEQSARLSLPSSSSMQ